MTKKQFSVLLLEITYSDKFFYYGNNSNEKVYQSIFLIKNAKKFIHEILTRFSVQGGGNAKNEE